ncbi:hypothetical protein F4811DRAFT_558095 [Daldinia bambusicola]|nr:hypothetical protein F4811DRAFT_558095 [Daldinia bambusicola]
MDAHQFSLLYGPNPNTRSPGPSETPDSQTEPLMSSFEALSVSPPNTMLRGMHLARALDAINHYSALVEGIFLAQKYPGDPKYRDYAGPECCRLARELRTRVSPDMGALLNPQLSLARKKHAWRSIHESLPDFAVINPYRFQQIKPHKHISLYEDVGEIPALREFDCTRSQDLRDEEVLLEYGGSLRFGPRAASAPEGWFYSNTVDKRFGFLPGTNRQDQHAIRSLRMAFYGPFGGWLRRPVPGGGKEAPWRRLFPTPEENAASGASNQKQPVAATGESSSFSKLHSVIGGPAASNPEDDVFKLRPQQCALCNIMFRANVFACEVNRRFERKEWQSQYRAQLPAVVRHMISEAWERVKPKLEAERLRNFHPNPDERYEIPKISRTKYFSTRGEECEETARLLSSFITKCVLEAAEPEPNILELQQPVPFWATIPLDPDTNGQLRDISSVPI